MGRDVFRSARQAVPDLSSELMIQTAAAVAETAPSHPLLKPGGNLREETVTHVHHWTDTLFTFKTTRDPSFRFLTGQFDMIGLFVDNQPLQIGRASCRERVCEIVWISVVSVSLNKKKQ